MMTRPGNCLLMALLAWWVLGGRIGMIRTSRSIIPHFYLDTGSVEVDFTPWIDRSDPDEPRPRFDLPLFYDGKWRVQPRGGLAEMVRKREERYLLIPG